MVLCYPIGLTLGGTVKGDPVRDIIKCAWENGVNFIDTAEGKGLLFLDLSILKDSIANYTGYANGESEREMYAYLPASSDIC
jgi:hypothetical protein